MENKMNISLRTVKQTDWKFILELRNQESVRMACHDTSITEPKTHFEYMKKLKKNPNAYQWIIMENGNDEGYIKIVDLEFGSSLKDEFRGKGIGTKAYDLVFKEAKKLGLKKLKATVKLNRKTPIHFEKKTGWKNLGIIYKNEKPYAYKLEKVL